MSRYSRLSGGSRWAARIHFEPDHMYRLHDVPASQVSEIGNYDGHISSVVARQTIGDAVRYHSSPRSVGYQRMRNSSTSPIIDMQMISNESRPF